MIENRLSYQEFSNFLTPILALKSIPDSMLSIERVFNITIDTVNDLYDYLNKYSVQFEGFRLQIRDLRKNSAGNIHLQIQLRIQNKWWYAFTLPEIRVVKAIQKICQTQISNLRFSKYEKTRFERERFETKSYVCTYYYDSLAFTNSSSEDGIKMSPLILGISNNDKYRFVEFNFCALSYEHRDSKVVLKDDWSDYMYY